MSAAAMAPQRFRSPGSAPRCWESTLRRTSLLLETGRGYVVLKPGADLRGADLRNVDLRGVDLSNADLRDADLTGTNLSETLLEGAKMEGAKGV